MNHVLLAAWDSAELDALAAAIVAERGDLHLTTATLGDVARRRLEDRPADLVVADLEMPEGQGVELVNWVRSRHPWTTIFGIEMGSLLEHAASSGCHEHFGRPLDARQIALRISQALAEQVYGYLENVSVAGVLQLLSFERRTCSLKIGGDDASAVLHLCKGELVHAQSGSLLGEEAALELISQRETKLLFTHLDPKVPQTISQRLDHMVMEAFRLQDEQERDRYARRSESGVTEVLQADVAHRLALLEEDNGEEETPRFLELSGCFGLINQETGVSRVVPPDSQIELWVDLVQLASNSWCKHAEFAKAVGADGAEEIVTTTRHYSLTVRRLALPEWHAAVWISRRDQANIAMARLELAQVARRLTSFCSLGCRICTRRCPFPSTTPGPRPGPET